MYCKYCGKQIEDDAKFCDGCGSPIQDAPQPVSVGTITIIREKSKTANKFPAVITIDGVPSGEIDVNEHTTISLPYGLHNVTIKVAANPSETFGVNITAAAPNPQLRFFVGGLGQPKLVNGSNSTVNMHDSSKTKKRMGPVKIAIIVIIIFAVFSSCVTLFSGTSNGESTNHTDASSTTASAEETVVESSGTEEASVPTQSVDWLKQYEDNGDYVISTDADVMFQYGGYYTGYNACTVVEISDISGGTIKANTESNTSFFFSLVFNFENKDEISDYSKGDIVEIVGTIQAPNAIGETVTLNGCHIVADGADAEAAAETLRAGADTQVANAQAYVAQLEEAAATVEAQNVEDYKASCATIDYDDVARNPDNYDGVTIVVSGSVIQVSEGWFNSVTLRVDDNGNIWYVTYSRDEDESRILEGDNITIYGECTGVTSYTSILGNTVTIPSIKGVYIE